MLGAQPPTQALLHTAQALEGTPYRAGGDTPAGFDCSGFVRHVFLTNGITLPRTSRDQAKVGFAVRRSAIRAGDLLFFTRQPGRGPITHVGIALDGKRMIHASSGRAKIVVDPLTLAYYHDRLKLVRRVLRRRGSKHH